MDKILKCNEIGTDCDFVACGKTEDEAITKAATHSWKAHNPAGTAAEFEETARAATYDDYCDYGDTEEMISDECSECYEACYECADECCS